MTSSIQDTPCIDTPDKHCGLSSSQYLQRFSNSEAPMPKAFEAHSPKVPAGTDPAVASKSSHELDDSPLSLWPPDKQLTFALKVPQNLDQLLPDTQISTQIQQATPKSAITVLYSDESLPDTQTDVLDQKIAWGNPICSDSQLLETGKCGPQSKYTSKSVHIHLDHILPDTRSDKQGLKSNVNSFTIADFPTPQIKSSANEDFLLPDAPCSIYGAAATSLTSRTSNQNDMDLPDTQVSLGDQPGSYNSALGYSLKTGPDSAVSMPSTASTSIQNDHDIPDPQVSSAGKLESSEKIGANVNSPCMQSSPSKQPFNKVTCRERKRIIVSTNRTPALTKAMCQWIDTTNYLLDPFREDHECWLHPSPPSGYLSMNGILRPYGKLQKTFNWKDRNGKHSLVLNFGIVSKIVNYKLTKQQKDGFINKQWHLSHLCGNWTCLNPAHTTVEPGNVNISRNNCFSHRSGCFHNPPCMKDKKVSLGADGKPTNHNASISGDIVLSAVDNWDDWSIQGFDDGDESTVVDDQDSESTTYRNGGNDYFPFNGHDEETL